MTLLYIDPGTGSMLFSILIGAAATLFFLFKALILKLKLFFSGKKSNIALDQSYKPCVIYSEGVQYFNTFLPILNAAERNAFPITYYTSSKEDPIFSLKFTYITASYIGEGNAAFAKLNLLSAGIVLMTTPSLDVYQLKRSKRVLHYCHILHMPNDATTYRLFALDYFDSVLLTGDYQARDIRYLEKERGIKEKELVTVGCTYLDVLQDKVSKMKEVKKEGEFTVLVSPSWGKVSVLSRYGERLLTPLVETGFNIIVRPHPQSRISEPQLLARLEEKYKGCANLTWDYNRDNSSSLSKANVMISDFSGIIFDYTFLFDRPVLYSVETLDLAPYDAYDVPHELWQYTVLEKIGIKLNEKDFPNIKEMLLSAASSEALSEERKKAREEAWQHRGEAGKRVLNFLKSTLERLTKKEEDKAA